MGPERCALSGLRGRTVRTGGGRAVPRGREGARPGRGRRARSWRCRVQGEAVSRFRDSVTGGHGGRHGARPRTGAGGAGTGGGGRSATEGAGGAPQVHVAAHHAGVRREHGPHPDGTHERLSMDTNWCLIRWTSDLTAGQRTAARARGGCGAGRGRAARPGAAGHGQGRDGCVPVRGGPRRAGTGVRRRPAARAGRGRVLAVRPDGGRGSPGVPGHRIRSCGSGPGTAPGPPSGRTRPPRCTPISPRGTTTGPRPGGTCSGARRSAPGA